MTTSSRLLEALISALQSHIGLKAILESLYIWFIHNSKEFVSRKAIEGVAQNPNLEDAICISKAIFEELSKRICIPLGNSSTNQSIGQEILQSESDAAVEEVLLLLRCCIASVSFLENEENVLLGRLGFLNRILCMLCSCQNNDSSQGCKTSFDMNSDVHLRLVCGMLEVFMDELITDKSLSRYIGISASFSPARETMCHCKDSGFVLKVASAHFLHSNSGFQAFEGSVSNLILMHKENRATPEISLAAAVSLLVNPALASIPAFLHAHLLSLISDVIGRVAVYGHMGFDRRFINCYMPAFERSISLYHKQLPKLVQTLSKDDGSVIKSTILRVGRQRPFESYVCSTMNEKLNSMIKELDCSSSTVISQRKSKMAEILNSYVKENLHLLDDSCRSIASLFLSDLVVKASSAESDDALLHMNGNIPPEDICLFASILKLISCSLMQTVLYMSNFRNPVHHKTSRGSFQSKEHEMLAGFFNSFGQYRIQLPVQQLVYDKLKAHFTRVDGSKLMFVHFTGLLSICLEGGIEILAKGCLYMMLSLMNVLYFEDRSLNFLSHLNSSETECESPAAVIDVTTTDIDASKGMQEGHTNIRSSSAIASNFKKIQKTCTRKGSASGQNAEARDTMVEDETCNATTFLKSLHKLSGSSTASLDEELADFIECKQGKDYTFWLKNRRKYRNQKLKKMADQLWEKKKATWISARHKRKP